MSSEPTGDAHGIELDGLPYAREIDDDHVSPVERIASDFAERIRRGEEVSMEMIIRRHREYANELREILPLVAELESWQSSISEEVTGEKRMESLVGEEFAGHRIESIVGRGGTATVFKATSRMNRVVAMKIFHPGLSRRSEYEVAKEVKPLQRLNHPGVLPVLSYGIFEKLSYHIMPLFEGVSLDRVIRRLKEVERTSLSELCSMPIDGPSLEWERNDFAAVANLGLRLADALEATHARGILHNDVKPSNVMLGVDGRAALTDFCPMREGIPDEEQVQGTLRYMAPERFEGVTGPQSDVFSLGVTLFELLTLSPAFRGDDRAELAQRVQTAQLLPPRTWNPDVPEHLSRIIRRATARKQSARYRTAAEVSADLHRYLAGNSIPGEFRFRVKRLLQGIFSKSAR